MAKKRVSNKKEKEHLAKVASLGCYVCERPAEVHHIRPKGLGISNRSSHYETIPLCFEHHRTGKDSIHLGKKLFIEKYGTEQEILEITKERIKNES